MLGFNNSEYDVLISNATQIRPNTFIFEVDRSTELIKPSNYDSIISESANRAQIPDSNYSSRGLRKSRYEGSETTAVDFERQNESQQDLLLSPIGVSNDKAKGSTKLAKLLHDNEKLAEDLHVLNKRSTVFNKNHQYHNKTTKNTSHG